MTVQRPRTAGLTFERFASPAEMAADQAAYWRSRPAHERLQAVSDMTTAAYLLADPTMDVTRMDKTLRRIERKRR